MPSIKWALMSRDHNGVYFVDPVAYPWIVPHRLFTMGRPLSTRDVESNRDEEPTAWRDWAAVFTGSILGYLCLILVILTYLNPALLSFDPVSLVFNKNISPFFAFSRGSGHFPKPEGFKIVALVPFHDHERTSILDCYLQVSFP